MDLELLPVPFFSTQQPLTTEVISKSSFTPLPPESSATGFCGATLSRDVKMEYGYSGNF